MQQEVQDLLAKLNVDDEKTRDDARYHLNVLMCTAWDRDRAYGEEWKPDLPPELQDIQLDQNTQREIIDHLTALIKQNAPSWASLIYSMTRLHPLIYMEQLLDIIQNHLHHLSHTRFSVHQAFVALDDCFMFSSEDDQAEIDRLLEKYNPIPVLENLLASPDVNEFDVDTLERVLHDLRWRDFLKFDSETIKKMILDGKNLQHAPLFDIDLQGEDLRHVDVATASLHDSNLADANLEGVDLHECSITYLQRANLRRANLTKAGLSFADVTHADLSDAILQAADLQGANFQGCTFSNTNLRGANLVQANLQDSSIADAQFDATTRLPNAEFWSPQTDLGMFTDATHPSFWRGYFPDDEVDLSHQDWSETNLQATNLRDGVLRGANFSRANLLMTGLNQVDGEGASFQNADMRRSNLSYANLKKADLCGANLTDALLWESDMEGALFDETTLLPDGSQWSPEVDMQRFTNPHHPDCQMHRYPLLGIFEPWRDQEREDYRNMMDQ